MTPCVMALDGERELEIPPGIKAFVRVSLNGPMVIDVKRAMQAAQKRGVFRGGAGL